MSFYGRLKGEGNLKNKKLEIKSMDDRKAQLAEKLKKANNILVTVSRNPSVDQLASCIALTLMLNKQGKHAAAVFSGNVPSTLEFLQPEETLEKNTDSLRDFIVSLDKSKADKLRYKVEDDVVRIFITPYRTSISEADLTFTQGDFNVDLMVALGVHMQEDLDDAITAHGRILHDATIATINTSTEGELGTINWTDAEASSLSELVTDLAKMLGNPDLIDGQIATALLTGIVAETARFSNEKTTSQTMNASATLLAAGANQQLVATKLSDAPDYQPSIQNEPELDEAHHEGGDGLLEIKHVDDDNPANQDDDSQPADNYQADNAAPEPEVAEAPYEEPPAPESEESSQPEPESQQDDMAQPEAVAESPEAALLAQAKQEPHSNIHVTPGARMIVEPPSLGSFLSPTEQGAADPLGMPLEEPPMMFNGKKDDITDEAPSGAPTPPPSTAAPVSPSWPSQNEASPASPPPPSPPAFDSNATPPPFQPPAASSASLPAAPDPASALPPAPAPPPASVPTPGAPATPAPPPPAWVPPPTPPEPDPVPWVPPPTPQPAAAPTANPTAPANDAIANHTLAELEQSVGSAHANEPGLPVPANIDSVRDEVNRALNDSAATVIDEPIQSLGAQPLGSELHPADPAGPFLDDILAGHPQPGDPPPLSTAPADPVEPPPDSQPPLPPSEPPSTPPMVIDPSAPPPVPPPIPFQFGNPQQPQ